jgi:hypothetical protein
MLNKEVISIGIAWKRYIKRFGRVEKNETLLKENQKP